MVDTQLRRPSGEREAAPPGMDAAVATRAGRPVLRIVHSYYEEDPRVRREAEALVGVGYPVTVISLRRPGDPPTGTVAGVEVQRLDVQRHQGAGLGIYLREYLSFFARSSWAAVRLHRRRHFRLVQVHSLPDFLAFAALPLRLAGVPLVLDLHEAMPEFFRTRFPGASNPLMNGLLRVQERLSIAISTRTLSVNAAMRDRLVGLGVQPTKLLVVPNSPALGRFDVASLPSREFRADGRLRLIYTGALTPTYELDATLRAVASIARQRPELDVVLDLYGRGDSEEVLRALAGELDIADKVIFHGRIPIEDVPAAVATADIGVAPTRLDPFTAVTLSTKVYEYAAMGKPVVASRLPLVAASFPPDTVSTYEPGSVDSLRDALLALVDDQQAREQRVAGTQRIVREAAWERASLPYLALVAELTGTDQTARE
jgi:glycosyltransferase involved in cell wall biosynthesis